ncbi:T3SS effector HopA1 family protein [Rhodococcoides corynebacterioides]|uniref:T3SS effector HopA1 family protein n=1 Tax=Rhodococcoides corynebacterioides TaxID=53972 RepID=UPI001C9A8974|nr:T3SS effector HopA1 family protein [Rhodococcus corynebacterioides]MBY6350951.1 hypothetical protein [Rhodococcus corynebacterioides]
MTAPERTREDLGSSARAVVEAVDVDLPASRVTVNGRTLTGDNRRELHRALSTALYDGWHSGQAPDVSVHPHRLRDPGLERALARGVESDRTLARARVIDRSDAARLPVTDEPDETTLVSLHGVRVRVPDRLVVDRDGDVVQVELAALRPALSPGFLVWDSPRSPMAAESVRLYLHVRRAHDAPAVWHDVLRRLRAATVDCRSKVLSAPALYPRRDAVVVYAAAADLPTLCDIGRTVAADHVDRLAEETSSFALRLGRGVALAAEPSDPEAARAGLSFGQHRADALATGILDAAEAGLSERAGADRIVANALRTRGIDPVRLYRDLESTWPEPTPT